MSEALVRVSVPFSSASVHPVLLVRGGSLPNSRSLVAVKLPKAVTGTPLRSRVLRLPESAHGARPRTLRAAAASSGTALDAGKEASPRDVEAVVTEEPNSRARITVNVPPAVCKGCYDRVLVEFGKTIRVPGFRPGKKVPENILVNYVGKQNVRNAAIEAVLKETLPKALSSVNGRALEDSVRIVTKFSELDSVFSPQGFLRYEVALDVAPEVKWVMPDAYKNLKVVIEIDEEIQAQKACEIELRRRHKAAGVLRIVEDRGLQIGDVAVLNIYARTAEQSDAGGETIPSAEQKGFHLDTEEGDDLLPGFLDAIVGIGRGEQKSFLLAFPDSWKQENLRSVKAQFTVECKELFYRDLPQLDDAIADQIFPGCSTLNQACENAEQEAREQATDNALLDELTKIVEVDVPQSLFEEQGRQLYGAYLLQLQASKRLNEQQLVSLSSENAVKVYLNNQKMNITKIVKQILAVGEIFKCEGLQLSLEELEKEVVDAVAEFKSHKQEYDEKRIREQVQGILEGAKVLEWLKQHAEIEFVTK
ncbi:Trigger factor-like protein [Nymphaea thermarum]|nr:Trigger factor-like protein [Nymphaea thermarum]